MKTNCKSILFLLPLIVATFSAQADTKEVIFNATTRVIQWENARNTVPCKENFFIKLTDLAATATGVTINVYETTGFTKDKNVTKKSGGRIQNWIATKITGSNDYKVLIESLMPHRFYVFEMIVTDPAGNTTIETPPTLATPLRSEMSTIQFLGGLGTTAFFQSDFSMPEHNLSLISGLKIKLGAVSTNPDVGRFGIYPRASKYALVVGAVLNDLNYHNAKIEASIVGIKPMIGFDFEFGHQGSIGLTVGTVFGKQASNEKLNDKKNFVTGIFLGLSFSADIFKGLKGNTPATSMPGTQ